MLYYSPNRRGILEFARAAWCDFVDPLALTPGTPSTKLHEAIRTISGTAGTAEQEFE